ncbi:MAG: DNA primase [gamma proteobacterium symbiont of Taylorina sp.]|nr:DNA primase [gamma proteobacterium symbiont of Taylorina sp.]
MTGTIPREFIDKVLAYTDIVELIDSRVPLKHSGNNHMACCPFHGEKTPSFSVSETKQFFHCFGCGASGDAIKFLMDYEHQSFVEAIEELAQIAGLDVPKVAYSNEQSKQTPEKFDLLQQVSNYYQYQLQNHPRSQSVQDYVQQRGLSSAVIKKFALGFAPPGWDNVLNIIGAEDQQKIQSLFDTGMLIKRDEDPLDKQLKQSSSHFTQKKVQHKSPWYDRFRDRLMFPIRDRRGRTIAFGGRILGDGKPKYLNSPETALFHKGQELYGLFELKQSLRKIERILVVEGYMDVVSLAQYELLYSVATLGTATTKEHLQKLFRLCDEVVFCFDGDRAGNEAAWRAMNNALPAVKAGKYARFMFLPDGEDPDTMIRRQGKKVFEAQIEKAKTFSEFFFDKLTQQVNIQTLDGRSKLIDLCKPYLEKIQPGSFQTLMIARLSELAEIDQTTLYPLLGIKQSRANNQVGTVPPAKKNKLERIHFLQTTSPVKKAIAYLLNDPSLSEIAGDPGRFSMLEHPHTIIFVQLLDLLQNDPHLSTARILANWQNSLQGKEVYQTLSNIAVEPLLIADKQAIRTEFNDIIQLLSRQCQQQRFEQLQNKQKNASLDKKELNEYIQLLNYSKK